DAPGLVVLRARPLAADGEGATEVLAQRARRDAVHVAVEALQDPHLEGGVLHRLLVEVVLVRGAGLRRAVAAAGLLLLGRGLASGRARALRRRHGWVLLSKARLA